jgi:hypothetical protein
MSVKGEKYTSMAKKMKHEKSEGKMERMMEYGKIKTKPMKAKKKPTMVKKAGKK